MKASIFLSEEASHPFNYARLYITRRVLIFYPSHRYDIEKKMTLVPQEWSGASQPQCSRWIENPCTLIKVVLYIS